MKAMSITISILIAVLCAPALIAQVTSVTFAAAPVTAGTTYTESGSYSTEMTLTKLTNSFQDVAPPPKQTHTVSRTKTVKVISVVGNDKITGADVSYTAVSLDGQNVTATYSGKHYLLSLAGNRVTALTYGDLAAVPESEAAFVKRDNSRIGQLRTMNRTFGGKTVAVGSALRVTAPEDLVDTEAGFDVDNFSMTLRSITGEAPEQTATFDVAFTMTNKIKKGNGAKAEDPDPFDTSSMSVAFSGTLSAKVSSSRILALNLNGPLTLTGAKATGGKKGAGGNEPRTMELAGSGNASIHSTFVY